MQYCKQLYLDGMTGWHLPTRLEMISLYDFGAAHEGFGGVSGATYMNVTQTTFRGSIGCYWDTGGQYTQYFYYWSSSVRDQNGTSAYLFTYSDCGGYLSTDDLGELISVAGIGTAYNVRCVK
jgi:hypothetical protein